MRSMDLTPGSTKCLAVIISYIEEHGYAPSFREICDMSGYTSTCTVDKHVDRLFLLGYLETDAPAGSSRAFRLSEKAKVWAKEQEAMQPAESCS